MPKIKYIFDGRIIPEISEKVGIKPITLYKRNQRYKGLCISYDELTAPPKESLVALLENRPDRARYIVVSGQRKSIKAWSEVTGIPRKTIIQWIYKHGESYVSKQIQKVLTTGVYIPNRERRLERCKFLTINGQEMTYTDCAKLLGISRQRVSQLIKKDREHFIKRVEAHQHKEQTDG